MSGAALSWDVVLNMTKIELELIPEPDMYMFSEKDTRSRVSWISNRYSKVKLTTSISNLITQRKNQNKLYTYTRIIYTVMQYLSFFRQLTSNR